jgi:hypothetical protein
VISTDFPAPLSSTSVVTRPLGISLSLVAVVLMALLHHVVVMIRVLSNGVTRSSRGLSDSALWAGHRPRRSRILPFCVDALGRRFELLPQAPIGDRAGDGWQPVRGRAISEDREHGQVR